MTGLRQVDCVQRGITACDHRQKHAFGKQDNSVPCCGAALSGSVPVTEWRQWKFEHDDLARRLTELRQQIIQVGLKTIGRRLRAKDVVAADFDDDQ